MLGILFWFAVLLLVVGAIAAFLAAFENAAGQVWLKLLAGLGGALGAIIGLLIVFAIIWAVWSLLMGTVIAPPKAEVPIVNVTNNVPVPNVNNVVNVPQQPAPVINNTLNVPTQVPPTPVPPTLVPPTAVPTATTAPTIAPVSSGCTMPVTLDQMPAWLANHFGGAANQWHQKVDQTGTKICAFEFLSAARELGVGNNVALGYGTNANASETTGTLSYGVRNADRSGWLAGYLVGPGDFTIAQIGKKEPEAIDTATWIPTAATNDQIKARTPAR